VFLNLTTMGLIISLVTVSLIWFIWGAVLDPETDKGPVEKAISHPGRWSRQVMKNWIEDAKEVLIDPRSTEEERTKALRDIEVFSKFVREEV
jgi:hypothetical protein